MLLLPLVLAGCFGSDDSGPPSFMEDSSAPQPYPENYRSELLAFMHTYLNDPVGVRDAMLADPVQRTVGGRDRYVACLRYSERQSDGTYRPPRESAVLFINGRLDRVLPNSSDACAGASFAPFPDLEKMSR
jgi:hypothetical protein